MEFFLDEISIGGMMKQNLNSVLDIHFKKSVGAFHTSLEKEDHKKSCFIYWNWIHGQMLVPGKPGWLEQFSDEPCPGSYPPYVSLLVDNIWFAGCSSSLNWFLPPVVVRTDGAAGVLGVKRGRFGEEDLNLLLGVFNDVSVHIHTHTHTHRDYIT